MTALKTPLGALETVTQESTGDIFLIGTYQGLPLAIETRSPKQPLEGVDFAFIRDKIIQFPDIKNRTEQFFKTMLADKSSASALGWTKGDITGSLLSYPEFSFSAGKDTWSIIYRESIFPIAQPYGILVNYRGDCIIGFEDISDAEEL
ncbi:MAG: hypothetical protein Q3966_06005 [Neisseria sp.]|nr:hypothetical protein [Neisseria sp.]